MKICKKCGEEFKNLNGTQRICSECKSTPKNEIERWLARDKKKKSQM